MIIKCKRQVQLAASHLSHAKLFGQGLEPKNISINALAKAIS